MRTEVVMPAMEMDQDTANLVRWLKSEGEHVEKGEPLMEIETDKVTVEIESPGTGILSEVRVAAGADVPVGQVIAVLIAGPQGERR
jgi:pyruvate/2-oxoglutarate dehydrogenase complex dihydrolipoamide acyltransferase (E2) component